MIFGARVLGEFGDDPNRYADAKSRKNYAGVTHHQGFRETSRCAGRYAGVTHHQGFRETSRCAGRYARNRRLAGACYLWAFSSLNASPGARAFYDQRRVAGDTHHRALRALANRLVGILHGCLRHGVLYDEDTAWAHRLEEAA